jgi:predicted ATPase/DNA-binding SARP family transcriptional activator
MADEPEGLEFRILGPVEAWRGGSPVSLGGKRQRALLALLLVARGKPVSEDKLVDELWHGDPPPGAHGTLQSYVSRLRSALGDATAVIGGRASYQADVAPHCVDADQFETLLDEGRASAARGAHERAYERFTAALGLWRGSPFGDVGDDGALRAEAARLEELRLGALEGRIEAELELGGADELVAELEMLVVEHPYRERLWGQLMLALYRAGRQTDALDAYRRARDLLAGDLGLEPGEDLNRLQLAILRHDVDEPTPATRRHRIPAPTSTFLGRIQQLDEVGRLLEQSRLVTLTGVGGVGKTRLALESARHALPDFPEAVFVDLSSLSQPEDVVRRIAGALDVREQVDASLDDQVANRVGTGELLLLLDNCEHLRDACAGFIRQVLPQCPGLRVLATSREFLGLDGETEYPVPPLEPADAIDLFLERARAARPRLPGDEDTRQTVAAICADLDGLPLAIELAAARVRALSLEEIAQRLADRFRFLVSWRRLTTARHQTLERAMDWSYGLLSPDEQMLLARLSVFSGWFTLDSVAGIIFESNAEEAFPDLERLVDASLVTAAVRDGSMRYRLLETVRQYGAKRLRERGETQAFRRRHALFFTERLRTEWETAAGNHGMWIEATRPDYDNVMTALVWSREEGTAEDQLMLAALIWRLWWVKGAFAEGRQWLESALVRGPDADPRLRAPAFEGAAGLAWAHGDNANAEQYGEEARRLYAEIGDARGEGRTMTTLGHVALTQSRFDLARERFEHTRDLAGRLLGTEKRAESSLALAVLNLGSVAHLAGDLEEGARLYDEARDRYAAVGDRYGVALSRHVKGGLAAEAGRPDEAAACVREALPVFVDLGFAQYTWQGVETAAAVARAHGDAAECVVLLGAAARLREGTGNAPAPWERLRTNELRAAEIQLDEGAFSAAWEEGRSLGKDEAVTRALRLLDT